MKPLPLLALLLFVSALAGMPAWAAPHGHCGPVKITPIPGDPGAYRIETVHGVTIGHRPSAPSSTSSKAAQRGPASPAQANAVLVFRVFPASFDADGDTLGTVHDTVVVAPGTTVRWERVGPAFHTVTNGRDSGDLSAASEYNYIFDDTTTVAGRVFTTEGEHDFFCYIHEPVMEGTIIVTSATTGVGPPGVLRRVAFTRPPSPNPTRGNVAFAIALPRTQTVSLTVHDVAGRLVSSLQSGVLTAGEHPFQWDGRGPGGRVLESGRYFIRLVAGDVRESRAVSLLR